MRKLLPAGAAAVVLTAGLALVAISASPAAAADAPRQVAYVNSDGALVAVDLLTNTRHQILSVAGVNQTVAAPDGRRVYALRTTGVVTVIDATASQPTTNIRVGAGPQAIQMAPDGLHAYVENGTGASISVIDTSTNTVTSTFTGFAGAAAAVISPDGQRLYVFQVGAVRTVSVVDTATGAVSATITVPTTATRMAISGDGGHVYLAGSTTAVYGIDTTTNTLSQLATLSQPGTGLAISPDGHRLYVNTSNEVVVLDTATGNVDATIQESGVTGQLALSADGSTLYVPAPNNDFVAVIDTATNKVKDKVITVNDASSVVLLTVPEFVQPTARLFVAPVTGTDGTVQVDASASTGFAFTSFRFDFGDGTVVQQSTGPAEHTYTVGGVYTVTVTVTDVLGRTSTATGSVTIALVQARTSLLAADGRYVTAESAGNQPLIANRTVRGAWETFDLVGLDADDVALFSLANGEYVGGDPNVGTDVIIANQPNLAGALIFHVVHGANGAFALQEKQTGGYVSDNNGTAPLSYNRSVIGPWEQFHQTVAGVTGNFRAGANGKWVTAESAGAKPLIANRTSPGLWETFDAIDAGDGYLAWYSEADGRFVTAESAGTQPLIANRSTIGDWEKFTLLHNADGSTSLLAHANGKYVTAESAGSQALIANRSTIGTWEEFNPTS